MQSLDEHFQRKCELYGGVKIERHEFISFGLSEDTAYIKYRKSGKDLKGVWVWFEVVLDDCSNLNLPSVHFECRWQDNGYVLKDNVYESTGRWKVRSWANGSTSSFMGCEKVISDFISTLPNPSWIERSIRISYDGWQNYAFLLVMNCPPIIYCLLYGWSIPAMVIFHILILVNCSCAIEKFESIAASLRFRMLVYELGAIFGLGSFIPALLIFFNQSCLWYYLLAVAVSAICLFGHLFIPNLGSYRVFKEASGLSICLPNRQTDRILEIVEEK